MEAVITGTLITPPRQNYAQRKDSPKFKQNTAIFYAIEEKITFLIKIFKNKFA